ncbi:expressed unknown protein [Seminavis robusta]|uniref:Uncharacterized protein n=1 Tax=Seminavis robusta TaxID=568900 RepID=A0A9N8DUH1_9STRA|nr:expressed unknown protein [Seminavis robusta]|eukprot:Sro366_g127580.1 n/a (354) ;mRNA; r:22648-23812
MHGPTTVFLLVLVLAHVSGAETITGIIYCDNYFEFYFNGELIQKDPMTFTPHNAVEVSFGWDGVSDKHYAILCQDYASESGYEYIDGGRPQLGDGALIAEFSDGTVTTPEWKLFVANHGPTEESEQAGCDGNNLDLCEVQENGNPVNWAAEDFDYYQWEDATVYSANEAGWGRAPTWEEGLGCCTATSPLDRSTLTLNNGCSVNYDPETGQEVMATVSESECLSPRDVLGDSVAVFLWGSDLEKDNRILFRYSILLDTYSFELDFGNSTSMNATNTSNVEMTNEEEESTPSLDITINGEPQEEPEVEKTVDSNDGEVAKLGGLNPASSSPLHLRLQAFAVGAAFMVGSIVLQH